MHIYRLRTTNGSLLAAREGTGPLHALAAAPTLDDQGRISVRVDRAVDLGSLHDHALDAPVTPGKIVAIGANYLDHIREAGMTPPAAPLIFAKFPSSVIGPVDEIEVDPAQTARVDWEVELAVVIGRRMRDVPRDQVFSYVLGYTIANDISARDVQFGDGQWVRGKSLDTFCPLGPALVLRDEIPDPQCLPLRTRVNGEIMQDSNTREMLFKIDELLAYVSAQFTLDPGDVVLTGTPWGCGEFMSPRRSLVPGDVVEVEIEGIGQMRNRVGLRKRAAA